MTEPDAFQSEMLLISLYGRIDLGTGCLRNRTDGGEGLYGQVFSSEHRAKIGAFRKTIAFSDKRVYHNQASRGGQKPFEAESLVRNLASN